MTALACHIEPDTVANDRTPARCCHRYIANQPGQSKYREAIAAKLPTGSGEIEGTHRYDIQEWLKLAGAW